MKSENIKKINQLGKAGYIISKISKVLLLIAVIGCLVGTVFMCFVPRDAVKLELSTAGSAVLYLNGEDHRNLFELDGLDGIDGTLELGGNRYEILLREGDVAATMEHTLYLSDVKWILLAAVLICAAAYVAMHFASRLCAYFKDCDTPFTEDIAKELVRLAWSLIPMALLSSGMDGFVQALLTQGQVDITLGVDLTQVLLILCVFMLAYIFKHGAALQQQSDETL